MHELLLDSLALAGQDAACHAPYAITSAPTLLFLMQASVQDTAQCNTHVVKHSPSTFSVGELWQSGRLLMPRPTIMPFKQTLKTQIKLSS